MTSSNKDMQIPLVKLSGSYAGRTRITLSESPSKTDEIKHVICHGINALGLREGDIFSFSPGRLSCLVTHVRDDVLSVMILEDVTCGPIYYKEQYWLSDVSDLNPEDDIFVFPYHIDRVMQQVGAEANLYIAVFRASDLNVVLHRLADIKGLVVNSSHLHTMLVHTVQTLCYVHKKELWTMTKDKLVDVPICWYRTIKKYDSSIEKIIISTFNLIREHNINLIRTENCDTLLSRIIEFNFPSYLSLLTHMQSEKVLVICGSTSSPSFTVQWNEPI